MNQESIEQLITIPKCPNCGYPLRKIPAGKKIKKNDITGEERVIEYDEFWVCTNPNYTMPFPPTKSMECGNKYNSWQL